MSNTKIIILDGCENGGKTDVANRLLKTLLDNNYKVCPQIIHYPEDSLLKKYFEFGDFENDIEKKCADVYFVSNLLINIKKDFDHLLKAEYDYIIVDRMILSTMMYQGLTESVRDLIVNLYDELFDTWFTYHDVSIQLYIFNEVYKTENTRELSTNYKKTHDDNAEFFASTISKCVDTISCKFYEHEELKIYSMLKDTFGNVPINIKQDIKLNKILENILLKKE